MKVVRPFKHLKGGVTGVMGKRVSSGKVNKTAKKQNLQNQRVQPPRGVLLVKCLPRGFYEEQLRNYFEQFGKITRLRLVRSRRTGGSKGFAYIEFKFPEVAQVAAETMHNYFMFKQIIKAVYIPPEKQQFDYFRTTLRQAMDKSGKLIWISSRTVDNRRKVKLHNNWTNENSNKRINRSLAKIKKLTNKYSDLGLDLSKVIMSSEQQ